MTCAQSVAGSYASLDGQCSSPILCPQCAASLAGIIRTYLHVFITTIAFIYQAFNGCAASDDAGWHENWGVGSEGDRITGEGAGSISGEASSGGAYVHVCVYHIICIGSHSLYSHIQNIPVSAMFPLFTLMYTALSTHPLICDHSRRWLA